MSDAISLLSVLGAVRSGGQAARGEAASGFAALFRGSGGDSETGGEAAAAPDAAALKDMYKMLTGLARKAAYLDQQGDDPAEVLEEVAALASDLAEALAEFDSDTGLGLMQVLEAGLQDQDGAGFTLSVAATEEAAGGVADEAEAPVDPAAAVQALQSAIATVTAALRSVSATAATAASVPVTAGADGEAEPELGPASQAPAPVMASERVTTSASQALRAAAVETVSAPAAVSETTTATAAVIGTAETAAAATAEETDGPLFFLPSRPVRSGDAGGPAAQALLSRIVAAAGAASEPTGNTPPLPAVAAVFSAGALTEVETRRSGPTEALITSEDIARALGREGRAGRDAAAATQARPAQAGAEQPRFAAALTDQVRSAEVSEGRTRIELSPRGLGSIEVDVTTAEDGTLKVVVRAENPVVLNSLRQERDLLAQALGGLDAGSLDLQSFSDSSGQEPQGDRSPSLTAIGDDDMAEAAVEAAAPQTAQIGAGRLDIVT
mgnify:CR=1 FL=1